MTITFFEIMARELEMAQFFALVNHDVKGCRNKMHC
jgi:hypothetical protein